MRTSRSSRLGLCLALALLLALRLETSPPFLASTKKDKAAAEEAERIRQEEEEKAKEEERIRREEQAKKREEERAAKEKQEAAEEELRKQLKERTEEALRLKRQELARPLNRFEERRERRRVRSILASGAVELPGLEDFPNRIKPEVKAQLDDAVKFFSETMRVPAVLIASAALGSLFLPGWAMDAEENPSPQFNTCRRLYLMLTVLTFCLMLTAVVVTSNAHAQLLELGRAGLTLEPTAMDLIMSCLEFEYLSCSLSYIFGVMAFMLANLSRMLAVFRYATTLRAAREPNLFGSMSTAVLATLLWWVHLINVRLTEYSNIGEMVARFARLLFARMALGQLGVMGFAALVMTFSSGIMAIRAVRPSGSIKGFA
eukprot:TRINITY_DN7735_c0_g4_i1.p1 TRINITY_DN7735_c0_g4~~TRINITY_DN7735_c0_g4_i1.p1  ORF type:complete len:381 (+),score=83.43 TRINITY_DN7735_c0_g4_i1:26-1144(+)